ncbi:MAG: hypothetical protein K0R24_2109 [Gammaproteobacteria bacterium]|jgi:hypothetical protein|nr:hypothetical protein [Gammaproteobacteria bacterium]
MAKSILKQQQANLKPKSITYPKGLKGLKQRLSLAHRIVHTLVDRGCCPETYFRLTALTEQVDECQAMVKELLSSPKPKVPS